MTLVFIVVLCQTVFALLRGSHSDQTKHQSREPYRGTDRETHWRRLERPIDPERRRPVRLAAGLRPAGDQRSVAFRL